MANATMFFPLSPVLRGEGSGVRGVAFGIKTPHPQPLSPEYRGEGSSFCNTGLSSRQLPLTAKGTIQGKIRTTRGIAMNLPSAAPIAYLNGRFLTLTEAHLTLHDAGFVWGATVTDLCRTFRSQPYRLADHLRRFRRSCELAYVPLRFPMLV